MPGMNRAPVAMTTCEVACCSPEEKALLGALLRDYRDTWRASHPDESTAFTVWDEKTSARVFNEVSRVPLPPPGAQTCQNTEYVRTHGHPSLSIGYMAWERKVNFMHAVGAHDPTATSQRMAGV